MFAGEPEEVISFILQVEAMKQANLPLTRRAHGIYGEVTPRRRLAYRTVADFIPDVKSNEG